MTLTEIGRRITLLTTGTATLRHDHCTRSIGGSLSRPEQAAVVGPLCGLSYVYRGVMVECQSGDHVCRLVMPDYPLHDRGFGAISTMTSLIEICSMSADCQLQSLC
ncbi:hypothetical protein JMJ56_30290 [Belnapia sp. T18]|uniref:Uncharacterized protein n=1 Tax=Belnapia arida TaxID=2804533 RepID=A0ABS1UE99_9PROT|nr:hypothetical protein [Belnapia arida]